MIQIILAHSAECEEELRAMGFEKKEVYVREVPCPGPSAEVKPKAEAEIFRMRNPPYRFLVSSTWGIGPD